MFMISNTRSCQEQNSKNHINRGDVIFYEIEINQPIDLEQLINDIYWPKAN